MITTNYYLGIEYSKDRIKCALSKFDGKNYILTDLQFFAQDESGTPLKKLIEWKDNSFKDIRIKAIISISESLIFLKELRIPNAKKSSMDEAVYWELSTASPLPPSQTIYEWMPIFEGKNETLVSAMAIRESEISSVIDDLEKANIEVITIEPSSVSLTRIAHENYKKNTMLLLVGHEETDIIVMKNGIPVFSTTSDVKLKRAKDEKWRLSETVSDEIAESTKELITFWESRSNEKIEQVQITGDLVDKYFGLAGSINKFANVPVNIVRQKQVKDFAIADLPKASVNRFLIPIGALIRLNGDIYDGANLIPAVKKIESQKQVLLSSNLKKLKTLNFVVGSYFVTILIIGLVLFSVNYMYQNKINKTMELINNHPGQMYTREVKTTNNYLNRIRTLMANQNDSGLVLKKISEFTPSEITLTGIKYKKENMSWTIIGTGKRDDILAYYKKLNSDLGAKEVKMPYSNLDQEEGNKFEITLLW